MSSDFDFSKTTTPTKKPAQKSGCGCLVIAGILCAVFFGCCGVCVIGAIMTPKSPAHAESKKGERTEEDEFVEITGIQNKAEREQRLKKWADENPDLMDRMNKRIKLRLTTS